VSHRLECYGLSSDRWFDELDLHTWAEFLALGMMDGVSLVRGRGLGEDKEFWVEREGLTAAPCGKGMGYISALFHCLCQFCVNSSGVVPMHQLF